MQMSIDEAGGSPFPVCIDYLFGFQSTIPSREGECKPLTIDADVRRVDLAGEDIDEICVPNEQVEWALATRGLDQFFSGHGSSGKLAV